MSRLPSFVLGAAFGAGGYFFIDPQHGKRRQNCMYPARLRR